MGKGSAIAWSLHELGMANFNDERLTKRGVALATSLLLHPQCSIPQACQSWARTKGAYRFFANDKVQSANMLHAHQRQLQTRATPEKTILVAQDTTTLNLSNRQIIGIGRVGDGGKGKIPLQGLFAHTGLAMTASGLPLGVTSQKVYARKAETVTEAYKQAVKAKPISEKETGRWVEAVTEARNVLPGKHLVIIGDRESDIYEVFQTGQERAVDLLVRASQNRRLAERTAKLFETAAAGRVLAVFEMDIPVDHRKTRKTQLTIRTAAVTLPPPKSRNLSENRPNITLTVLDVSEEHPAENTAPVHWVLLTSLSVTTPDEAKEKVRWYTYRWRVERFHYTLKTGAFNIEKLQFDTFGRFAKAITLYSLVAQRILFTLYYEREHPGDGATALFSADEIRLLCLREDRSPASLTCHQAVLATAKIGGFLARRSDGPPGLKSLWIGFQALHYMVQGMLLGEKQAGVA